MPALQGLDRHGVALFAGSFSKVLFPSLRLGYLVVPSDLVDRVAATKSVTSRHAPVLEQAVLADFMVEGHFGRHVRRMREVYAERLGVLLEGARERLTGLLEISSVEAGLQTVGWLASGIDGERAAAAAAQRGVEVTPLSRYGRTRMAREGLQIGFAATRTRFGAAFGSLRARSKVWDLTRIVSASRHGADRLQVNCASAGAPSLGNLRIGANCSARQPR